MKKILGFFMAVAAGLSLVSCANQLETSSPSVVDSDFVFSDITTAKAVILGAYDIYVDLVNTGPTVNFETIGSDVERCSVGISVALIGAAQLYGGSTAYTVENFDINTFDYWDDYYSVISICNQIIYNIKNLDNYSELIDSAPNDWSDLLGQAYALRATMYYDMARIYGDVIYMTENEVGMDVKTLTNRDYVIEKEIECLIEVEPYMYAMGENSHYPDQMTRNYVDGLIGRLCFMEAGYATRRTDLGSDFYTDADGNVLSFDVWGTDNSRNAQYARRTDWLDFYEIALPYLEKAVNQPAGVVLTTADPRTTESSGRSYGNPYQYYFEQVTNQIMAEETIYEVTMKQDGGGSRIAYNWGRGSDGGSPAYPPKANAQICTYPETLYGLFDPQDMRRDVSCSVTGSTGTGAEALYTYSLANKNTVGIGMNKYDINRQSMPDTRQLYSGINYVVMRQADVILMLAEAYAQTGNESAAVTELRKVHDRAFPEAVRDEKYAELIAECGSVLEAIYQERKLEFVGENSRRWDLVRTGKLPEVAVELRAKLVSDMTQLKSQGYIQYDNGNQFPAYVWTKLMDAKSLLGYRLTAQTPDGLDENSDEYALLYPSWRGQHDDWESVAVYNGADASAVTAGDNTNLAIKGLFRYIEPGSAEALALEANGYSQTNWGILTYCSVDADTGLIYEDSAREAQWSSELLCGYSDDDYAARNAPIYLMPFNESVSVTTGLKNGYGFKSGSSTTE